MSTLEARTTDHDKVLGKTLKPFKSCKGCWYFQRSILNPKCDYNTEWTSRVEPISGDRVYEAVGQVTAAQQRAANGLCQFDRKLYSTFWGALWKALKGK